jgi:hypothetical protein
VTAVDDAKKQLAWKALSAGAAAISVLVTRRIITALWQHFRGEPPPEGTNDRKVTLSSALTFAVATAVGVAVARVVSARLSARAWEVATHEAPPDFG